MRILPESLAHLEVPIPANDHRSNGQTGRYSELMQTNIGCERPMGLLPRPDPHKR
jgi:hypothetical protein